ncbi:MAG TPA: DUF2231 domain-containing protein [Baekduia sp.]|uniref:DUF2231 domain-containing protein n=1 Tax=Baekduia sp. TaxID=2600305 RepID=UPI002C083751|nr:DUF2231 domain-containing protein [Baekduia sp.]HMJ36278.1 DUF2231 domain-containing protein [Baekduia sp.]
MSADASAAAPPSIPSRPSAAPPWELILLGLTVLSLALIPVEIHRAFGLPAHPLLIHIPVILVPLVGVAALALMARPAWIERHGLLVGIFAVAATAATILAVGAGEALRADRGGGPPGEAAAIDAHASAGETLRILIVLFTLALLGTLYARRRALASPAMLGLRVLVAALAIASVFFVIRTGHLGAKLTWGGGEGGGGGGPPPAFRFGG